MTYSAFLTLLRAAPAMIALWNRLGRTPFNDFALWGGLAAEAAAIIARISGVHVPPIADIAAAGGMAGGLAHKRSVAKDRGADDEWAKRAFSPKD